METTAKERVISLVGGRLTDSFKEYLAENLPSDILAEYYDGFSVDQVATDISEGIRKWADGYTVERLGELVIEYVDDYLDDESDGDRGA